MPYLWPKTFHRPCHDLLGLMIHLVYQDAPENFEIELIKIEKFLLQDVSSVFEPGVQVFGNFA